MVGLNGGWPRSLPGAGDLGEVDIVPDQVQHKAGEMVLWANVLAKMLKYHISFDRCRQSPSRARCGLIGGSAPFATSYGEAQAPA
jgi:hypothetical protein